MTLRPRVFGWRVNVVIGHWWQNSLEAQASILEWNFSLVSFLQLLFDCTPSRP
jgi:hypothetical protein